ncbi:MAG: hypothetical protein GWM98_26135 [Nitrospinaceae bacterium]|nr:glycosyltransferase family 9 protein [Nitrospinaceae bacterium]NIR57312.1 glycosyltransferase family 9 protein [Nitrospinaceae bacterium]NIS87764.1 glycosyltransferase family 9 protein [Nitrospinaceae bacterium]NIT84634.1 glycosyltransferase family 9 protein [Nitrospinaceae bacterium]NIU46813.1 glycosyltransferase family 9 protein [Nitrospinaceae bacterium]
MLTRLWPVDRYVELLGSLLESGPYRIVLITGPEDGPVVDPIRARYPECIDTRNLSFGQKASILRRCRLMVGNDSAPIHIAVALGVPTFSLWGPTNPNRYGDPAAHHFPIFKKIECSPCYADGEFPDCRDNECLKDISAQEVWKKIQTELVKKLEPALRKTALPAP